YEAPPGGPGYIGQLAEVAVGAYTEIEEIIAPVQAAPGDLVTVEVRVRNLHTGTIYIATTGRYDSVDILPTEDYAIVDPGATRSFYFSFTMPQNDVELRVWSFYWIGTEWYQDDYSYVDIALVPPEEGRVNMGFTLKIINAPPGSTHWSAEFYSEEEGAFIYPPDALALDEAWDCAYNPYGATDLRVRVLDIVHAITLHDAPNLGPIEDGKDYTYDCSTGVLYEAVPAISLWPLAIIGGLGVLGVGAAIAFTMARPGK
ncbi:unnamed protein product, partial [marine sediment metagenome]